MNPKDKWMKISKQMLTSPVLILLSSVFNNQQTPQQNKLEILAHLAKPPNKLAQPSCSRACLPNDIKRFRDLGDCSHHGQE